MRFGIFNHTPAPGFKNLPGYNLNERLRLLSLAKNAPISTRGAALENFIEDEMLYLRLLFSRAGQPPLLRSQALDAAKRALGSHQHRFGEQRLEFMGAIPALVLSEPVAAAAPAAVAAPIPAAAPAAVAAPIPAAVPAPIPAADAKPVVQIPPVDPAEMMVSQGISGIKL